MPERRYYARLGGNARWKAVPLLSRASIVSVPPCASAMPRARYNPRPSPVEPRPRANRSKRVGSRSGATPGPSSRTVSTAHSPSGRSLASTDTTMGGALGRVLDRVAEEILERLAHALGIARPPQCGGSLDKQVRARRAQ